MMNAFLAQTPTTVRSQARRRVRGDRPEVEREGRQRVGAEEVEAEDGAVDEEHGEQ